MNIPSITGTMQYSIGEVYWVTVVFFSKNEISAYNFSKRIRYHPSRACEAFFLGGVFFFWNCRFFLGCTYFFGDIPFWGGHVPFFGGCTFYFIICRFSFFQMVCP
jgi:hypothetical protein